MIAQRLLFFGAMLSALILAAACASTTTDMQHPAASATGKAAESVLSCFGVLPVQVSLADDVLLSADEEKNLTAGATVVDAILHEVLSNNSKARFLEAEQVIGLQSPEAVVKLAASREVAHNIGCNAILETSLSRYVEREGGPYGVQQPAAVTLSYRLYEVDKGTVLCHGRFEEEQQALMDNLFSIGKAGRRGMGWLTAEELARDGLTSKLRECTHLTK
ncbi:MAG: hypothetical protein HQQ73_10735 [Desulfobulbaceae bacterium]|nr:hypothetical protein [Desulfobulbaceae bacterium]